MTDRTDLDWWLSLKDDLNWTFAKTMKDSPHSYVIRDKDLPAESFERAVRVIRTFGEPGKFYSKTHIYLTHGEEKWWTMGAPVWKTKVINVATVGQSYGVQDAPRTYTGVESPYDAIATEYDEKWPHDEEWAAIRQAVVEMCGAFAPLTLDIGGGTGRLLDLGLVPNSMCTVIDESQAMLNELVRKVNRAKKALPEIRAGRAEDVDFGPAYDLGLAVNGVASRISESVIDRMAACCSNLVLMPVSGGPNSDMCRSLDGAVVRRVGKFDLVTVKG